MREYAYFPMVRAIIGKQEWIASMKQVPGLKFAVETYAASRIPGRYRREISKIARKNGLDYIDVLLSNLAYEVAMVSLVADKMPSITGLLAAIAAGSQRATECGLRPAGCTTVGKKEAGKPPEFWRNLDWPDPDGLLGRDTRELKMGGGVTSIGFSGFRGVLTGSNGNFAAAINAVFVEDDCGLVLGEPPVFVLRRALEEKNMLRSMEILKTTRLICPVVFTVVTRSGHMMAIERSQTRFAIRKAEQVSPGVKAVVTTNDTRVLKSKGAKLPDDLGETSDRRYDNMVAGIQAGSDQRQLMREAEFGCTIHTAMSKLESGEPALSVV